MRKLTSCPKLERFKMVLQWQMWPKKPFFADFFHIHQLLHALMKSGRSPCACTHHCPSVHGNNKTFVALRLSGSGGAQASDGQNRWKVRSSIAQGVRVRSLHDRVPERCKGLKWVKENQERDKDTGHHWKDKCKG